MYLNFLKGSFIFTFNLVQFNHSIKSLKIDSFLMHNDKRFLLKQFNKSHSSLIEILSFPQTCFAPMATLWSFGFLITTFYYIALVATYFGDKLTAGAISKSIQLYLYLMITLNLSMADINLLMTDELSTLHLIAVDIESANKNEKYYFKVLLEKIKYPSV